MRRPAAVLLCLLSVLASAREADPEFLRVLHPGPLPAPLAATVERLDASRIIQHLAFLTDPRREGRGLGTKGLEATAGYLAEQLKAMGIPPLGPSYIQAVPLRKVRPAAGSISLRTRSASITFRTGRDAVLPPVAPGTYSAPLVFAGYGIQEPALGHDDFQGLDLRGKVVLFLDGLPPGENWRKPDLVERYASPRPADRYDSRLALLEKLGARAAIALETGLDRRITEGKEPLLPYFLAAPNVATSEGPPLARAALKPGLLRLFAHHGEGTATLAIRGHVSTIKGLNVLGQLEGSDPALRHQAILLGAHMDHLGMPNGVLHPGADDNASGVSALLEIARSLAASPSRPRRTVLMAFWTGEEEGKFGSGHYTRHPLWPLAATTYLNLDMIAHPWTLAELRTLAEQSKRKDSKAFLEGMDPACFAEPGLPPGHPELAAALVRAGLGTGMSLHLDWTDGRNGGSDYRDFARREVPFIRFFGSYFPAYHTPGDTLDQLDPEQVKRMARLVLATTWLLSDR